MASTSNGSRNNKDCNCFKDRLHKSCPCILILEDRKLRPKEKWLVWFNLRLRILWPLSSHLQQGVSEWWKELYSPYSSSAILCLNFLLQVYLCRASWRRLILRKKHRTHRSTAWSKGRGEFKCSRVCIPRITLWSHINVSYSPNLDQNCQNQERKCGNQ